MQRDRSIARGKKTVPEEMKKKRRGGITSKPRKNEKRGRGVTWVLGQQGNTGGRKNSAIGKQPNRQHDERRDLLAGKGNGVG